MDNPIKYTTINSFTRAPCANQLISYLVILAQNISFWLFVQPNYASHSYRVCMMAVFAVSTVLLMILTVLVSASDPSDPIMVDYKKGKSSALAETGKACLFCEYCESYVIATSRHCKICDRCVERFDHHCIWINNCIGSANYRLFIAMIFAALTNMLAFLGSVALLWLEGRWHMFLVGMIVNWVMFAVVAVFSLLISGLICLHLYLIYKDTTTFEYIMSKRTNQISPIRPVSNAQINEPSQISNENESRSKSSLQRGENREVNKTENEMNPHISAFQNMEPEEGKSSDFQSIEHIKSTHNRLPLQKISHHRSEASQQYQDQRSFNDFYRKHKGLKILVGGAIAVRPKRPNSAKQLRSLNQSKQMRKQQNHAQHLIVVSDNGDNASVKTEEKE